MNLKKQNKKSENPKQEVQYYLTNKIQNERTLYYIYYFD